MKFAHVAFGAAAILILLPLLAIGGGCRITVENDDNGQQIVAGMGRMKTTVKRGVDGTLTKTFYREDTRGRYEETTLVQRADGALQKSDRKGRRYTSYRPPRP